ncbi:MAG: hypothetical protein QM715_10780 [Nibricoccus sp.]
MTLPPNCLPPENAALSGDLLAGLGQPAGATEAADGTPFATLLADAAPGENANQPAGEPARAAGGPAVALYSGICYSNVLQTATGEATEAAIDSVPEDEEPVLPPDVDPAPSEESALLLAYQLIAGQWVPQPVSLQAEPALTTAAAARAGDEAVSVNQGDGFAAQPGEAPVAEPTSGIAPAKVDPAASANALVFKEAKSATTTDKIMAASNTPTRTQATEQKSESTPSRSEPAATPSDNVISPCSVPEAASSNGMTNVVSELPRPINNLPAKFTAPGSDPRAEDASGVNSLSSSAEKKTLVADAKGVKSAGRQIGTNVANRGYSMPYSAANKSSAPSTTALSQALPAGGVQSGSSSAAIEIEAPSSVHAPRLVQEIRAIADRISTIDRNTVEVRFDFNESDRLSVRVEYRDGAVHTTFRTDSESLREVIAREWQAQAVSAEPRAYRVAEPVFSNNVATSGDLSQSGQGSSQSQGRAFEQQAAPTFNGLAQQGRSSSGASFGAPSSAAATVRPETSLHLHTFA